MKKIIGLLCIILVLASCKSKKRVVTTKKHKTHHASNPNTTQNTSTTTSSSTKKIISKALSFKGTKYKYGGTTKSGVDCSGLMFTSFKSGNINLPRTAYLQSKKGIKVATKNITKGDLVFFKTSNKNKINHVGLVVSNQNGNVKFVHASTSRGVMISSLKDGYWANAYAFAKRITKTNNIPKKNNTNSTNTSQIYTVKSGDTLYGIARKFSGVSAKNIMDYNNLSSSSLKPGMQLKIPL